MAGQALRKLPDGIPTEPEAKEGTLKRQAPESNTLLKEAEQALQKPKESLEQKKRRILERCGCL